MSDVERLERELDLARLAEELEQAREAMHADRNPETIRAFKDLSKQYATLRTAFRLAFPTSPVSEGDAIARPDTVRASTQVQGG